MKIVVVTLFPEFIEQAVGFGVLGRAIERGVLEVRTVNPRQYATDVHKTVDDRPYGGGPGMVLKAEPLWLAMADAAMIAPSARRVYLAADGAPVTQSKVAELAALGEVVLVAGRYEGVDERFVEACIDESLSVGDIVLSGGELPALMLVDAMSRLLPGTLGCAESAGAGVVRDGAARLAALHAAGELAGSRRAGGAEGRQPRRDRALAQEAVARAHVAAATRPAAAAELSREEVALLDEYRAEQDAPRNGQGSNYCEKGET